MCETKPNRTNPGMMFCRERLFPRGISAQFDRSRSGTSRHLVGLVTLCLLTVMIGSTDLKAAAPKPGELLEIKARAGEKELVIRFRFCPPGSLQPGQPKPDNAGDDKKESQGSDERGGLAGLLAASSKVQFQGFFLTEMEITIDQAAVLLGKDRFGQLRDRLLSDSLGKGEGKKSNQYLVDALNTESNKFPIFGVTLGEAVTMCNRLSELTSGQESENGLSIETRQFRLPSHAEWQFACRSTADNAKAKKRPHFHSWVLVEGLDKDIRADWNQIVKEMGGEQQSLAGTQFDLESVLEKKGVESKIPIQVLNAILANALNFSCPLTGVTSAPFVPVDEGMANDWKLQHMHDNVNEWTLTTKDPAKLWGELLTPSMQGKKVLFLAGGNNLAFALREPGAWKLLTIWGGYPMDYKSGLPKPWSVAEGNDFKNKVNDQVPGVRMLLARTIKENWFAFVRKAAITGDDELQDRRATFDSFRQTVTDIVPTTRASSFVVAMGVYESLVLLKSAEARDRATGKKLLVDSCKAITGKSSGSSALSLLGGNPAGGAKRENPDRLFFRLLASEIGEDTVDSPAP